MKQYKIASILMIIHGGFMEIGGTIFAGALLLGSSDKMGIGQFFTFIIPYLQENLVLMLVMGAIFGTVRVIGAIGLWNNRMWGLALSVINCVITMALMIFMLPAGVMDGILACTALVLMLTAYFGDREIA